MFGLFRPKTEKISLHIERLMMTMDMSYKEGKLDVTLFAYQKLSTAMEELEEAGWTEKQLIVFLRERGLAKMAVDDDYAKKVVEAAERYQWMSA